MFKNSGVTVKFLVAITLAILVIQTGSGAVSLIQSRNSQSEQTENFAKLMRQIQEEENALLEEELMGKEAATAALLTEVAASYIVGYDFDALANLAEITMKDDEFVFLNFYGADGSALTEELSSQDADVEEISHPILFDGEEIGSLVVGLTHEHSIHVYEEVKSNIDQMIVNAKAEQEKAAWSLIFWSSGIGMAGLILLASLTWFLLSRIITGPIGKVASGLSMSSANVSRASEQVSVSSETLSEGTSNQASALEETSASLEELASQTKNNSDNAQKASQEANEAQKATEKGKTAMQRMTQAIEKIKDSSDETSKIIKTIDEIAFQTNLLALNAAVEAARAGDAGKGFAVVAEEVRNLAKRSADSAQSTSTLIDQSQTNADNGVSVAREVSNILNEISERVQSATGLVGEMTSSAAEQSQGIDQINSAITQIDKVTQNNSVSAEQSATASREMHSLSGDLNSMVSQLQMIINGGSGSVETANSPLQSEMDVADFVPPVANYSAPREVYTPTPAAGVGAGSMEQVIPLTDDDF